jgi:hypothetical protein
MAIKIITISDLEKKLKAEGYTNQKKDSQNRIIVYVDGDRKSELQTIAKIINGKYTTQKNGSGWKSTVGAVLLRNFVILAKPGTGGVAGSLASLDARVFSKNGTSGVYPWLGKEEPVVFFQNAKDIEKSIIDGCKSTRLLGDNIADAYRDFFKSGKFKWDPQTPATTLKKLGVYTGEVLVGWVFLTGSQRKYFQNNPFKGTPKRFILPTDPAFSGVDSWIEMRDGSVYSLSSKFGAGAKASLFSNLLEKGIEKKDKLSDSVFKDLCMAAAKNSYSFKKSRQIVYEFGVRNVLKIPKSAISDPNQIYDQIVSRKMGDEAKKVISEIRSYPGVDDVVISNLKSGASVSNFFNREIAKLLNEDAKSVKQMKEILQGKDYWQGNLNISSWMDGELQFRWLSSADASLNIVGNKGSASDITSKQGWINYELTYE